MFIPKHLIQEAQKSLQNLWSAKNTFLICRLGSFKPNNHVTLVVTARRVTRPHPQFTDKSPDTVNLVKFFRPEAVFEAANDFPRS